MDIMDCSKSYCLGLSLGYVIMAYCLELAFNSYSNYVTQGIELNLKSLQLRGKPPN